ncbi:Hypothetical_protein [Hexamita inflata]|uniref:Hypothetical_protein n=1 Tax=Hexamita inflata TaxID=28002 RepID=A0AA86ULE5_9EUKA|nr:Hypothetical protein HINF_LOCUS43487 [Hexamita inflata]
MFSKAQFTVSLVFAFIIYQAQHVFLHVDNQQTNLFSLWFTILAELLCTIIFLSRVLADQQESYVIKTSTIVFVFTAWITASMASTHSIQNVHTYFAFQLTLCTISNCILSFYVASMISLILQVYHKTGANKYKLVPLYVIIVLFSKALSFGMLQLIKLDYHDSHTIYYVAAVTFLFSLILFFLNSAYSYKRLEQFLFKQQVTTTNNIRSPEHFFELLNSPNDLQMLYVEERTPVQQKMHKRAYIITLLTSFNYSFSQLNIFNLMGEFELWYVFLIVSLVLLAGAYLLANKLAHNFQIGSISTISFQIVCTILLLICQILSKFFDVRLYQIIVVSLSQLAMTLVSPFSFGELDYYEQEDFKHVVYFYQIGEQLGKFVDSFVQDVQGTEAYVKTAVGIAITAATLAAISKKKQITFL